MPRATHLRLLPPPDAPGWEGDAPLETDVEAAREMVLRLLGTRARSRQELARTLARKGVGADVADIVLDRLQDVGLVDDRAFAREYVLSGGTTKGPMVLAVELRARGISADDAAEALAHAPDPGRAVRAVVTKRWPQLRRLPPDTALRRAAGLLTRRGFDPAAAAPILASLRGEDPAR